MLGWLWLKRLRPDRAARYYLESLSRDPGNKENRYAFQRAVTQISYLLCWPAFALFAGSVAIIASLYVRFYNSSVVDNIAGVAILLQVPLGILMCRHRFRETLALYPFRLGRSIRTPADRNYILSTACAYFATVLAGVIIALTAPASLEAKSTQLLPYIAPFAFPLAPILVWLEWRQKMRVEAIVLSLGFGGIQLTLIALVYAYGGTRFATHLVLPAMMTSFTAFFLIVCGNVVIE